MVELLDPAVAAGVVLEGLCRLCGHQTELGRVIRAGQRYDTEQHAASALAAWALAEGEEDAEAFCQNNLCGLSLAAASAELVARQPITTSFDVVAALFPGMAAGAGAPEPSEARFAPTRSMLSEPTSTPPALPRASPRLVARALAAVMLADGEIRPRERRFLDDFLAASGALPLTEDDLRPWRPGDLGWPEDPAPLITAMVELAFIDRQRDGSEWRVIREFARHWQFPLAELEAMGRQAEHRTASTMKRLWGALRGLLIVKES